jgi:hypothetical protein
MAEDENIIKKLERRIEIDRSYFEFSYPPII